MAAVFLWIYVAAGQSTVGKFPSSLKIKAINVSSGLVPIYDTKTVNIKIMAEPSIWKKLSADSFSAYVDLSAYSAGTYEVPVIVVSSTPGVQIVEKDPSKIMISLEPISEKEVDINRKVEGNAAQGLVAGNISLTPNKVQIRGAKSVIDSITEATITIALNGETENFKKVVPVAAYDDRGEIINGVEFTPADVNADVSVVKASNNRTVGIKVKTAGVPKTGYFVSNIAVSPSVVDITGPLTVLSEINYIETLVVDLGNLASDIEKDVNLSIPSGLALQTGSPGRVSVKVGVSPLDASKEFLVPVSYKNLDLEFKVTVSNPDQIKAVLAGTSEIISNLKLSDISLNLDLKNKGAGVYSYDISTDNFNLPAGVSLVTALPSALSLTIEKR